MLTRDGLMHASMYGFLCMYVCMYVCTRSKCMHTG